MPDWCKSTREEVGDLRFSVCREEVAAETFGRSGDIREEVMPPVSSYDPRCQGGDMRVRLPIAKGGDSDG